MVPQPEELDASPSPPGSAGSKCDGDATSSTSMLLARMATLEAALLEQNSALVGLMKWVTDSQKSSTAGGDPLKPAVVPAAEMAARQSDSAPSAAGAVDAATQTIAPWTDRPDSPAVLDTAASSGTVETVAAPGADIAPPPRTQSLPSPSSRQAPRPAVDPELRRRRAAFAKQSAAGHPTPSTVAAPKGPRPSPADAAMAAARRQLRRAQSQAGKDDSEEEGQLAWLGRVLVMLLAVAALGLGIAAQAIMPAEADAGISLEL